MLALFKAQAGKAEESIKLLEDTLTANPKIGESYWRLAYTYYITGNKEKAREVILLAKERNIIFDGQGQKVEEMVMTATSQKK